jgi:hypothetical protein
MTAMGFTKKILTGLALVCGVAITAQANTEMQDLIARTEAEKTDLTARHTAELNNLTTRLTTERDEAVARREKELTDHFTAQIAASKRRRTS